MSQKAFKKAVKNAVKEDVNTDVKKAIKKQTIIRAGSNTISAAIDKGRQARAALKFAAKLEAKANVSKGGKDASEAKALAKTATDAAMHRIAASVATNHQIARHVGVEEAKTVSVAAASAADKAAKAAANAVGAEKHALLKESALRRARAKTAKEVYMKFNASDKTKAAKETNIAAEKVAAVARNAMNAASSAIGPAKEAFLKIAAKNAAKAKTGIRKAAAEKAAAKKVTQKLAAKKDTQKRHKKQFVHRVAPTTQSPTTTVHFHPQSGKNDLVSTAVKNAHAAHKAVKLAAKLDAKANENKGGKDAAQVARMAAYAAMRKNLISLKSNRNVVKNFGANAATAVAAAATAEADREVKASVKAVGPARDVLKNKAALQMAEAILAKKILDKLTAADGRVKSENITGKA